MSDRKRQMRYPIANALAAEIEADLRDYCLELHRAGSLRRRTPYVSDLEFVLVPTRVADLFGSPGDVTPLELKIRSLVANGNFRAHERPADGAKMKRFSVPFTWHEGILAIRTGPAQLSKRMVTQRKRGGLLDNNCICRDGRVWSDIGDRVAGARVPVPEPIYVPTEKEFFELLSIEWTPPEERLPSGLGRPA